MAGRMAGVVDGRARIARQRTSATGDTGGQATRTNMPGSPIDRSGTRDRRTGGTIAGRANRRAATSAQASRTRTAGPQQVGPGFG